MEWKHLGTEALIALYDHRTLFGKSKQRRPQPEAVYVGRPSTTPL